MRSWFDRKTGVQTQLDGGRLLALRKSQGASLAETASATGLSIATLSVLEREGACPSSESIEALARHYGEALSKSGAIVVLP